MRTVKSLKREIARLRQRHRRAQIRLNKFTLKLMLEGVDVAAMSLFGPYSRTYCEYWRFVHTATGLAMSLQDVQTEYAALRVMARNKSTKGA